MAEKVSIVLTSQQWEQILDLIVSVPAYKSANSAVSEHVQDIVDRELAKLHLARKPSEAALADLDATYHELSRQCAVCGHEYAKHSALNESCPWGKWYHETSRFREAISQ